MASKELQRLLQVLGERNISLGPDDVAWAFDSTATKDSIQAWAQEYLNDTSLLTLEERAFFEKQVSLKPQDASSAQIIPDQSFEDAISSLEASTSAIEKQSRLLETQREALKKIKQRTGGDAADASQSRGGKTDRERSQLEYECNELSDALHAKFRSAAKKRDSGTGSIKPSVERILERDDRLLDGLEKLLPHLLNDGGDEDTSEETQRLCQALQHYTSAEIRARVDAAYLEGARSYGSRANGVNGKPSREAQQLASLNAELDELCREIDGLSTMAVDNQYRSPITQAMASAKADADANKSSWTEYLSSAIQYSTARLTTVLEQLDDQRAHSRATKAMSSALDEILAASADKHGDAQPGPQSPKKTAQKGLKPLRLVQANLSDPQDPASQLLRQLDVRVSGELNASTLAKASAERTENVTALQANTEHGIADIIAQSLADANKDVQHLLQAVFTHSQYGNTHLESESVRSGIRELETQTQELGEKMRSLDVDTIVKNAKAKQEEILQRS